MNDATNELKFTGSSVILSVKDLDAALTYYRDVLGFRDFFRYGDYAGMMLGEVEVHLAGPTVQSNRVTGESSVYVFCEGVDDYYKAIAARGATVVDPIMSYPYNMRDFVIEDPDGNLITFGQLTDEEGKLIFKH